jgi:hypothetical protein
MPVSVLWEINLVEHKMCSYLEWQLNVNPSTLHDFESCICHTGPGSYLMVVQPHTMPAPFTHSVSPQTPPDVHRPGLIEVASAKPSPIEAPKLFSQPQNHLSI